MIRAHLAAALLVAVALTAGPAAQEPVVEVPRGTETGEAPGDPGARRANIGNIQPTSNAERRDASPVECSGTFTTGSQAPAAPDAAVRALVETYSDARDKGDAAALTALFTADADQLVSSGEWRKGREAVVKGSLASSQQTQGKRTFTIETVRLVAADVALVDSRYDIAQTDGTTRRMWAAWLLVKDGAAWKIAGIRNMLPAAPGR